MEKGM